MSAIEWVEEFDDYENSVWVGVSPFSTESGPDAIADVMWRLRQVICENQIIWQSDHDEGILRDTTAWPILDEAKAACQAIHDEIMASEVKP